MKMYILVGIVALVVLASVVQAFQISGLKDKITSNDITGNAASGQGETYEQMIARMHPDQVQQAKPKTQSAPTMVGGC